jgi:hypothetical protein
MKMQKTQNKQHSTKKRKHTGQQGTFTRRASVLDSTESHVIGTNNFVSAGQDRPAAFLTDPKVNG